MLESNHVRLEVTNFPVIMEDTGMENRDLKFQCVLLLIFSTPGRFSAENKSFFFRELYSYFSFYPREKYEVGFFFFFL